MVITRRDEMRVEAPVDYLEEVAATPLRELAERMFSRTAGATLIGGNQVRLLEDGGENYGAWLAAIRAAKHHVHFENYFICEDEIGREFREAFVARAREGIQVRVIYDWLGGVGKASRGFWKSMRKAGVEIRVHNPPNVARPMSWISRDHRKTLVVDGAVGYVTGLCVGQMWVGDPARRVAPWRDTGVEIRGPAVAEVGRAFARSWALVGPPLPKLDLAESAAVGDVSLRIVASEPATASMLRLDQLVAAIARNRLWLTDAYYSGISSYFQALRAAAQDGVDVRLLVPNATDIPMLKPFSRAGYRALLEAGIRVFEWNGTMLHAKTAVADGRWARVGSTNLNIASWLGNFELDAVIEDAGFAAEMEHLYLRDLANSTELVLDNRRKVCAPGQPRRQRGGIRRGSGSTGAVAAGAMRIGNAVGAVLTSRRVLAPVQPGLTCLVGALLCAFALLVTVFPRAIAVPAAGLGLWAGLALLWRAIQLRRRSKQASNAVVKEPEASVARTSTASAGTPETIHTDAERRGLKAR